jgi:RNA polymerase sigma-70 factor (ECF subfamily)
MRLAANEVVERVRQGDTEAFSELVFSHYRAVYAAAMATTRNSHDAEDLTQTCFLDAFHRLGELRDASRFGPWLYAIARNRCREWLRSHSRRPLLASDSPGVQPANPRELPTNPHTKAIARERDAAVRRAVDSLPPKYRAVVALRFAGELTFAEIAEALDLKLSAVWMRWHRARKMLQERLGEWASDEVEEVSACVADELTSS